VKVNQRQRFGVVRGCTISKDMKNALLLVVALAALAPQQAGQPINTMCPVKPKQKARANLTVVYEGQVIGFC